MKISRKILTVLILSLLVLPRLPVMAQGATAATTSVETAEVATAVSNAPPVSVSIEVATKKKTVFGVRINSSNHSEPMVMFGQNAELKAGETAEAVVVFGGSAKVHGKVRDAVVVIGGSAEVDGEVDDAVVAIFGNVHLQPGAVIHHDAVAVMGSVTAGPETQVNGDAVAIGGKLEIEDGATVKGDKVNVSLPPPFSDFGWLRDWFRYCALEFRPLAPQVPFVWIIAAVFFLIYLLIALVFPGAVTTCVDDLNRRPATTFFMGLLTKLLVPFVYLILAATGVGLIVTPFIWVALLLCAIVGKVAILQWIGFRIGRPFGGGFQTPLLAFLLGIFLLTLLYLVPVVGLLTYILLGVWGLGCGVSTAFARLRRETPDKPIGRPPQFADAPGSTMAPPTVNPGTAPTTGTEATSEAAAAFGTGSSATPASPPPASAPVALPAAASFPKAGFWERVCAALLDTILIGVLVTITSTGSLFLIVALAYYAGMWTWRGTTIGGILLKLQVVRTDGRPLTFVVALVRGLAAAFSVVIFFLGFLWIAWDKDSQGWHDKIAGTDVIRLPRSMPLVML